MLRFLVLTLSIFLIMPGCEKDENKNSSEDTLTGKIRGVDFTFGAARYGSISDELYRVIVSNDGPTLIEPCDTNLDDVYIDFKPKKTTERAEMNPSGFSTGENTVVFHHPDFFQNLTIDRVGYYQITEENDSTLNITMDFTFDDNNFMKGSFIATKCF